MFIQILRCWKAIRRFRRYQPQPVTWGTMSRWLTQFDRADRKILIGLLQYVIYFTEKQTRDHLVQRNSLLLAKLKREGIPLNKVIYVSIDDAGSSSAVMLNMLKEAALLERANCKFLDSKNINELNKETNRLEEGAIIYVDDFVGTGDQFCKSRDFAAEYIFGTFSEFLLSVCICEEAIYKLGARGIEACTAHLHSINERPLHELNSTLKPTIKERLIELGDTLGRGSLGYKGLASMVVFYRNSPNSLPRLFRGNMNQSPKVGILPRTTDLSPMK